MNFPAQWQDWVFLAGSLVFFASLVPALRDREKPPLFTSFLTAGQLAVFCAAYLTLGLWLAATGAVLVGVTWLTLGLQRLLRDGKRERVLKRAVWYCGGREREG